jgi:hypothetical protein
VGALVALDDRQFGLRQRTQPLLDLVEAELAVSGDRQVLLPGHRALDLLGHPGHPRHFADHALGRGPGLPAAGLDDVP